MHGNRVLYSRQPHKFQTTGDSSLRQKPGESSANHKLSDLKTIAPFVTGFCKIIDARVDHLWSIRGCSVSVCLSARTRCRCMFSKALIKMAPERFDNGIPESRLCFVWASLGVFSLRTYLYSNCWLLAWLLACGVIIFAYANST